MKGSYITRKVVVTGGAGVLGREAVELLRRQGYHAVSFDVLETAGENRVQGDVSDREAMAGTFSEAFAVCHFAATSENESDRARIAELDVLGTVEALEAASKARVGRFVFASDVSVFGVGPERGHKPDYLPIDESHRTNPIGPKAAAKLGAEAMARAYHSRGELKVTILRFADFTVGERPIRQENGPGGLACNIHEARVTVEDAARAVSLALQSNTAFGTYIIAARSRYTAEGELEDPQHALNAIRQWGVKSIKVDMWHSGSSFSSAKAQLELLYDPRF